MHFTQYILFILTACHLISVGCASRQDLYYLNNRLAVLESNYKKSEKKNEAVRSRMSRSQSATLHEESEKIREDLRIFSGRLDEIDYLLNQKIKVLKNSDKNLEEKLNSFHDRIIQLEEFLGLEKQTNTSGKINSGTDNKNLSDDKTYSLAKKAFDAGDFTKARALFDNFINKYPESDKVDNAHFWISDSYYREKWYEKAILEYQTVIEKYPNGNKIAAAYLKQGFSFYKLGDMGNARIILNNLIKKYPKSNEAKIARKKLREF